MFTQQLEKPTAHLKEIKFSKKKLITNQDNLYKNFKKNTPIFSKGLNSHIEFSPLDKNEYIVVHGNLIHIYNDQDEIIQEFSRFGGTQHTVNYRRDGTVFMTGDEEGRMRLIATKSSDMSKQNTNLPLRNFQAHDSPIHQVKFLGIDKVLSFSDDKSIGLWDVISTNCVNSFQEHQDYVRTGCILSENTFASGSYDHSVKIWDIKTNKSIKTLDHGKPIESIIKHPTEPILITAGGSHIKVWNLSTYKFKKYVTHQNTITNIRFNQDGSKMFSSSIDGYFKFYDTKNYSILHSMKFKDQLLSFGVSNDELRIVVGALGNITKMTRRDEIKPILEYKSDLLTTTNYRNMINTYLQDQIFQIQNQVHLPQQRTINLSKLQTKLRFFDYKGALDEALELGNPINVLSLIQELKNRNELLNSLESRNEETILPLLKFIIQYIRDPSYSSMLIELTESVLNIYTPVIGESKTVDEHFRIIRKLIFKRFN
eukprot:gene11256-4075_t